MQAQTERAEERFRKSNPLLSNGNRKRLFMREILLKITQKITTWHEKMFKFLIKRSKTSIWFTFLLLFICIYEIFEHIIIPAFLIWWGIR